MRIVLDLDSNNMGKVVSIVDDDGKPIERVQSIDIHLDCDGLPTVTMKMIPQKLELLCPDKLVEKINNYTFTQQLD